MVRLTDAAGTKLICAIRLVASAAFLTISSYSLVASSVAEASSHSTLNLLIRIFFVRFADFLRLRWWLLRVTPDGTVSIGRPTH